MGHPSLSWIASTSGIHFSHHRLNGMKCNPLGWLLPMANRLDGERCRPLQCRSNFADDLMNKQNLRHRWDQFITRNIQECQTWKKNKINFCRFKFSKLIHLTLVYDAFDFFPLSIKRKILGQGNVRWTSYSLWFIDGVTVNFFQFKFQKFV